eukprot:Lithocolla_globosa_v1_NODE_6045_length_1144_cov_7.490358.p1 type:complete len:338 gc:universal NODE_6045_length_1144_cov_7.490358:1104-91(-)
MARTYRDWLLPLVKGDVELVVNIQKHRTPRLDRYFKICGFLGSHDFYMVILPTFFWLGHSQFARYATFIAGSGMYSCNFAKDLFCLPRPHSPAVQLSDSHNKEYGFPSSHTVNSLGLPLWSIMYFFYHHQNASNDLYWWVVFAGIWFCVSISFSRMYCGMHGLTDVVGGFWFGFCLFVFWWSTFEFWDDFLTNASDWLVYLSALVFVVISIITYPVPRRATPSHDDAISFVAVMAGVGIGTHHFAASQFSINLPHVATIAYSSDLGVMVTVAREILGIVVILLWRVVAKKLSSLLLPKSDNSRAISSLIVRSISYSGIGYLSCCIIPILFSLTHLAP